MPKRIYIYWFLSVASLLLFSCTNGQDDEVKYLKNVVETTEGGNVKTSTFLYSGSQLLSIEDDFTIKKFTYTSAFITEIVTTNKSNSVKATVSYTYDDGNLKTVKSIGDYVIRYTHNTDGTVSYEKFDISILNLEIKIHHGVLYFKEGNMIREERILDDVAPSIISKYNVNYDYDFNKNPLHYILGYEKLLDQEGVISTNNYIISTVETTIEKDNQIISSASFYKNTFKYDAGNYPVEKTSLVSIPHKGISYNLKTTYYY
ncbi:hypothetical protein [Flavobacterium ovatum]|uniref:hypothetical protein n=1 Tax=Flavobacterium ovatum TaxID=1928857 RepID=UPI00344D6230